MYSEMVDYGDAGIGNYVDLQSCVGLGAATCTNLVRKDWFINLSHGSKVESLLNPSYSGSRRIQRKFQWSLTTRGAQDTPDARAIGPGKGDMFLVSTRVLFQGVAL